MQYFINTFISTSYGRSTDHVSFLPTLMYFANTLLVLPIASSSCKQEFRDAQLINSLRPFVWKHKSKGISKRTWLTLRLGDDV